MSAPETPDAPAPRREFLKSAACVALGGCALAAPVGAVVVVLANPLKAKGGTLVVKVASLDSLPLNGPPQFFQIVTERRDAWTKFPASAAGAVFLQRIGEKEVRAFHSACPHLGCAVEFQSARDAFYCPCHDSTFAKTGEVQGKSPSRRGLDSLTVELRGEGEVWVHFQNFEAGKAEKIPVA